MSRLGGGPRISGENGFFNFGPQKKPMEKMQG